MSAFVFSPFVFSIWLKPAMSSAGPQYGYDPAGSLTGIAMPSGAMTVTPTAANAVAGTPWSKDMLFQAMTWSAD